MNCLEIAQPVRQIKRHRPAALVWQWVSRWAAPGAASSWPRCAIIFAMMGLLPASSHCGWGQPVVAQDPAGESPRETAPSESISLETKDRVVLRCEWFPGTQQKTTVPVILLHDWGGSRSDMYPLADRLQKDLGCSVLVPDWRGHGESLDLVGGGQRLDRERFGRNELASMMEDIETCKRFLRDKHHAGELNIDTLCLVATHQMATAAVAWSITDWHWPPYAGKRQGQDVKLLVLISPVRRFKTYVMNDYLRVPPLAASPAPGISTMVVYGAQDPTTDREGRSIVDTLSRGRPGNIPVEERFELREVFWESFATDRVGAPLVDRSDSNVVTAIVNLVKGKLVDRAERYPWQDRQTK